VEIEGQEVKKPPSGEPKRPAVAAQEKPADSAALKGNHRTRPSKSFLSTTLLVALAIVAVAAGALIAALTLRRFDNKQQIIINDFLVSTDSASSDSKSAASGDFGKEVADIFASDQTTSFSRVVASASLMAW